ncbi:unnamed protein product, partial [Closterium sp. NIES-64]
ATCTVVLFSNVAYRLHAPGLTLYAPLLSDLPHHHRACLVWGMPCRSHLHSGAVHQSRLLRLPSWLWHDRCWLRARYVRRLGATPTVSSASFTYYTLPSFGITPAAYTMRLAYNGCTNLTAASAPSIQSYCNVERAPGGVGDCTEIRQYYQPGCVGAYSLFPVTPGTGMSTGSIP